MSTCAQKVRFTLHEKQLDWDSVVLNFRQGDQFKPEYLQINPKDLVPMLVHDDNIITESNIIIEYLKEAFPQQPLLPEDPLSRAKVRSWIKNWMTACILKWWY
jgi:glutathione S-transferase